MKFVRFTGGTEYSGTNFCEYDIYTDNTPNCVIEVDLNDLSEGNAQDYEYLVTGWNDSYFENEEDKEAALDEYYENIWGEWEEITEKEFREDLGDEAVDCMIKDFIERNKR